MIKHYGFDPRLVEIKPEDYHFGDAQLAGEPLQPDGDWTPYLPVFEVQAPGYETSGCTAFGTLNALEILYKRQFNIEPNYSDRYTYINAGVTQAGANPNNAAESIRKDGVINEATLPMPETYEEFNSPRPMSANYLRQGRQWLKTHKFGHDWVLTGTPNNNALKAALPYSPLGISVTAWQEDENGLFIDYGLPNTHWTVLIRFEDDCPVVFDSYKKEIKKLSPDHKICFAKRYSLNQTELSTSLWGNILKWLGLAGI